MSEKERKRGKKRKSARFDTRLLLKYAPASGSAEPVREARALDLSEAGVRFRADEEFREGTVLNLKFMFPGEPMELLGRIVRVTPAEEKGKTVYEVAAAFSGLGEKERDKIDMWFYRERIDVDRQSGKDSGYDRRRSERFPVSRAYARIRRKGLIAGGKWRRGLIRQISRHGALIIAKSCFAAGEKVEALLYFPAYGQPLRVVAKIARVDERFPDYETGLEFLKVKKSDGEKLDKDKYLQNLIDRADSEFF